MSVTSGHRCVYHHNHHLPHHVHDFFPIFDTSPRPFHHNGNHRYFILLYSSEKPYLKAQSTDIKALNLPPFRTWYGRTRKLRIAFVLEIEDATGQWKQLFWTEHSRVPTWNGPVTMYGSPSRRMVLDSDRLSSVLHTLPPSSLSSFT